MFLSVFFVPLVFGVQLPDDLPEEFEAEMNYFLKYKTAQKIANDTKLAETKDIKVLVIHPDTRKVVMRDAVSLDEKSNSNEELIDKRGSIQVFDAQLQEFIYQGHCNDIMDFYAKYVDKSGPCEGDTDSLKGDAGEVFTKDILQLASVVKTLSDIGKRMLAEALPKYCGNRDKIDVFENLSGVRYQDPKMIGNEYNHLYEVHRDSSPPRAKTPEGYELLRQRLDSTPDHGEKEMSFNLWFHFNNYDNPQFAMLDKRTQKKEEEVYIGLEALRDPAVTLKYGEQHKWLYYQQKGIGYATIFQTEHVFHGAFEIPKKLLPESPVTRHSMDIRFRCFYPDDSEEKTGNPTN